MDKREFISFHLSAPLRSEAKKTKVKRKTNNPQFEEVFYFEVCVIYFRLTCWQSVKDREIVHWAQKTSEHHSCVLMYSLVADILTIKPLTFISRYITLNSGFGTWLQGFDPISLRSIGKVAALYWARRPGLVHGSIVMLKQKSILPELLLRKLDTIPMKSLYISRYIVPKIIESRLSSILMCSGSVVGTVSSQQKGPGFKFRSFHLIAKGYTLNSPYPGICSDWTSTTTSSLHNCCCYRRSCRSLS